MIEALKNWLAAEENAANPFYDLVKWISEIINFIASL